MTRWAALLCVYGGAAWALVQLLQGRPRDALNWLLLGICLCIAICVWWDRYRPWDRFWE